MFVRYKMCRMAAVAHSVSALSQYNEPGISPQSGRCVFKSSSCWCRLRPSAGRFPSNQRMVPSHHNADASYKKNILEYAAWKLSNMQLMLAFSPAVSGMVRQQPADGRVRRKTLVKVSNITWIHVEPNLKYLVCLFRPKVSNKYTIVRYR